MAVRRKLLTGPGVTHADMPVVDRRAPVPQGAEAAKAAPPSFDRRFQLGLPVKKLQGGASRASPRALAGPAASKTDDAAGSGIVLVPVIHETLASAMARTGVTDAGELVEIALQQLAIRAGGPGPR